MSIEWNTVAADFARDGALRDIYILRTTSSDWQHALDTICATATGIEFRRGDQPLPLPSSASAIFDSSSGLGRLLTFHIGSIGLACHFFHDADIEFDFWPHDLAGQSDLDDLFRFIQRLGDSVGKPVVVSPENSPDNAFLRYSPDTHSMVYIPCPTLGNV
jgi:hypothetical protein